MKDLLKRLSVLVSIYLIVYFAIMFSIYYREMSKGDINHDGAVNSLDLSKLLSNYNK